MLTDSQFRQRRCSHLAGHLQVAIVISAQVRRAGRLDGGGGIATRGGCKTRWHAGTAQNTLVDAVTRWSRCFKRASFSSQFEI